MRGRIWLILGAVVGVAMALGHVPYFAGAARSMADVAVRMVDSGGNHLISAVQATGAPRRAVLGVASLLAVIAPGVTALLLVLAARGTMRLRVLVGLLVALLGVAAYFYHPAGVATGVVVLALVAAGLLVVATGPLIAAPLAALAGLIAGTYLPRLFTDSAVVELGTTESMHLALWGYGGDPLALRLALVIVAAIPFAFGLRAVFRH